MFLSMVSTEQMEACRLEPEDTGPQTQCHKFRFTDRTHSLEPTNTGSQRGHRHRPTSWRQQTQAPRLEPSKNTGLQTETHTQEPTDWSLQTQVQR